MSDDELILPPTYLDPPRRYSLAHGGCLVAIAIMLILALIALWLPATVANREIKERIRCSRNLHQIGLALLNYQAKYGRYPPAYTVDRKGRRMHSWRVLILEFLDHDLYTKYDFSQPWNSPENLEFAKSVAADGLYHCPAENAGDSSWTSYVMLVGPRAISPGPTGRKRSEITDGEANTAVIVEMSPSGILWTEPNDLEVSKMSFMIGDPDHPSARSSHAASPGSTQVMFADGHIEFLPGTNGGMDLEEYLEAISTVNGGEDMTKFKNR